MTLDFALLGRWFIALWALGWIALPISRRIFPALPDAGLSAGRVLFVILATLVCFWGASLHLFPLRFAPLVWLILALACAWNWKHLENRDFVRHNWRSLAVSDAIFAFSFALFAWVRMSHPEAGDLEKPMDMALLSAAMRADFLPFENPWFSGNAFTNYYYFGPLCGASMSRTLGTAPHFAYNLVFIAWCAFFLSTLWSVGAALTRSFKGGFFVLLLVGLGGHLEPLRQISQKKQLWPLDWWSTSRVIPNTINEYPAFTLGIGDLHAHFYAFSFAVLWFALLLNLWHASALRRRTILAICGLVLGAWLMTNTWDAPLFGLLLITTIWFSNSPKNQSETPLAASSTKPERAQKLDWAWNFAPFIVAILAALPYFTKFKSQVSGAVFDPWIPDLFSFALLWGGWIALGLIALMLPRASSTKDFLRILMLGVGVLALLAPFVFYIRGAFGDGDLRHQDTVFKFGLQAWLLLGTAISAEVWIRFRALKSRPKMVLAPVAIALFCALMLAPISVFYGRAVAGRTGDFGLNAMRFLPKSEQNAILWLQTQTRLGDSLVENVRGKDGKPIGDYDATIARFSTFSGVPAALGWPDHAYVWGANYGEVQTRGSQILAARDARSRRELAQQFRANFWVFGANEPLEREELTRAEIFRGNDGSNAAILQLK